MAIMSKLILLCILAPLVGQAASITILKNVRIEPVTEFTVKELWSATTPTQVDFGDVVADYRMIDVERPIFSGRWRQCGLVMVGSRDLGMSTVAFRIWTKRACTITPREPRTLENGHEVRLDLFADPEVSVPLRVSKQLVVMAGRATIGQIRSD